jgi:hypothetical protein
MAIINMLRSGKGNGDSGSVFNYHMYPRPDLKVDNMGVQIGWENQPDAFHLSQRWNMCSCFNSGAVQRAKESAGEDNCIIEEGDEIPLVWIPSKWTLESITLDVRSGVEGMLVDVKRYSVPAGGKVIANATQVAVELTDLDVSPQPGITINQAYLDALTCKERVPLDQFCKECEKEGCYFEKRLTTPVVVGADANGKVCGRSGQYLSLVIKTLPDGFDCSSCCLEVSLGARVRVPFIGD